MNSSYEISRHPLTGDVMWKINDIDLAIVDAGKSIVQKFVSEYNYNDYTLSIYDILSGETLGVECDIEDISDVVANIYCVEHANLSFIGLNSLSDSYVVGMELTKGRLAPGCYRLINGKLTSME